MATTRTELTGNWQVIVADDTVEYFAKIEGVNNVLISRSETEPTDEVNAHRMNSNNCFSHQLIKGKLWARAVGSKAFISITV